MSRPVKLHLLPAAACVLAALLLYLPFRSASLDDFDSYNFVRALAEFNPALYQPQPPGYVLYVWLGRAALALLADPRLALTTLSAVSAALACGLLFLTGSLLFNRRVGLIAALLVMVTPLMWLNAGKALSDAAGLCAQAVAALALALALRRRLPLWVAAGLIGVAAGFRPQAAVGIGLMWIVLAARQRPPARVWAGSLLAGAAGALSWLLPTLAAFHWNADAMRGYMSAPVGFVVGQESLFATALTPQSIAARLQAVWELSSRAVFGPQPAWLLILLAVGGLVLIIIKPHRSSETCEVSTRLCLAWLLPQVALQFLFLNPELTRYLLALLFPAALLVAAGLDHLVPASARPWRWLVPLGVALAFCGLVGAAALPLAQTLHTVLSPPEQLAASLAQRYPRDSTFILAKQSYNALTYHLPGWQVRFADAYDPATLPRLLNDSGATYIVVADPEGAQPDEQYVQIDTLQFARDPQVHAKHASVSAYIFGLASALGPADFGLPADGVIHIGSAQAGKYLLGGWYQQEDIGGTPGRWIGSEASAGLRLLLAPGQTTLTLRALSFTPNQVITLTCDGQALGSAPAPQQWTDIDFVLPAACTTAHADQPAHIDIRPSIRRAPAANGASTDRRPLAIAIAEVHIH